MLCCVVVLCWVCVIISVIILSGAALLLLLLHSHAHTRLQHKNSSLLYFWQFSFAANCGTCFGNSLLLLCAFCCCCFSMCVCFYYYYYFVLHVHAPHFHLLCVSFSVVGQEFGGFCFWRIFGRLLLTLTAGASDRGKSAARKLLYKNRTQPSHRDTRDTCKNCICLGLRLF